MRTFPRFLPGILVFAGCAGDGLPTAVRFPDAPSHAVFAPPAEIAGFYEIVDENGHTIWQDITNAPPSGGSFRLFHPWQGGLRECEPVDIGGVVVTQCLELVSWSWNTDDRRCDRDPSYPFAPTYWLENDEYTYMPYCVFAEWNPHWPSMAGETWRVIASAGAPGGLSFKRWEVSFGGVPAACEEASGTQCTVTTAITGTRPYFRLVYGAGFDLAGFLPPIDNGAAVNTAKAGSAIPVSFDLGADHGLGILAAGSPSSAQVACDLAQETSAIESTASSGMSGLSYSTETGIYTYVWKTEKSWAGTCRELTVTLTDGSTHSAQFRFAR